MRSSTFLLATVLSALTPGAVLAQTERTSPAWREECKTMTEALRSGPVHAGYEYARDLVHRCDESGGRALAYRWAMVTEEDPMDLAQLRGRTREFRDRDLLFRLLEFVQESSRATNIRVALIDVLVSYYAPGRDLSNAIRDPETIPARCILGSSPHHHSRESVNPIRREDRVLILEVVEALASREVDGRVRQVAACALSGMRLVG